MDNDIIAVLLAGGKSSRMGYDKQLITIDKQSIVKKNIEILNTIFDKVVVVTNTKYIYNDSDCTVIKDIYADKGPIAGIHSAIHNFNKDIFLIACDMPILDVEYIKYVIDTYKTTNKSIVSMLFNENIEPFYSIYSKDLLLDIENNIENDSLSLRRFIKNSDTYYINYNNLFNDKNLFININTPEELEDFIRGNYGSNKKS